MTTHTRRGLLRTGGAIAVPLVAGCSQNNGSPSGEDDPEADDSEADNFDPALRINDQYLSPAFPIEFVEPEFEPQTGFGGDARIVYVHWHGFEDSHWHQAPLELTAGETLVGRTRFLLENNEELPLGDGETFSQVVEATPDTPEGLLTIEIDGDRLELTGERSNEGGTSNEGELEFQLWADEDLRWRSPLLPVEIH